MSMLTVKGILINVYKSPDHTKDDGSVQEGRHKLQILGDMPVQGGEVRKDLISLSAHDVDNYLGLEGTEITLPIAVFAAAKGKIVYYIPKGL